jgi:hypothetical protein
MSNIANTIAYVAKNYEMPLTASQIVQILESSDNLPESVNSKSDIGRAVQMSNLLNKNIKRTFALSSSGGKTCRYRMSCKHDGKNTLWTFSSSKGTKSKAKSNTSSNSTANNSSVSEPIAIDDRQTYWIRRYAENGFTYRAIASLVFNIPATDVDERMMDRVGTIARKYNCGVMQYRRMMSDRAETVFKTLNRVKRVKPILRSLNKVRIYTV